MRRSIRVGCPIERSRSVAGASSRVCHPPALSPTPRHATPHHTTPRNATPRHITPHHTTSRASRMSSNRMAALSLQHAVWLLPIRGTGFSYEFELRVTAVTQWGSNLPPTTTLTCLSASLDSQLATCIPPTVLRTLVQLVSRQLDQTLATSWTKPFEEAIPDLAAHGRVPHTGSEPTNGRSAAPVGLPPS